MNHKLLLLLTAVLGIPLASAENEYETEENNVAPSREYIDLSTSLVYDYDAATGTLTPTGTTGAITAFVCADAYLRNQLTLCTGSSFNPCPRTSCGAALTAIVGPGQIKHVHRITGACGVTVTITITQNSNLVVSFLGSGTAADWCRPGSHAVWNYVDGRLLASDSVGF